MDIPIVLKPENGIYRVDFSVEFRAVTIPHHTLVELSNWRFLRIRVCGMNSNDISHQYIATTPEENRITYQDLQRIFCEILNSCGMTYYPLSALRDTYVLRALAGGIKPQYLDAILGESNAASVYMDYISVMATVQEEKTSLKYMGAGITQSHETNKLIYRPSIGMMKDLCYLKVACCSVV